VNRSHRNNETTTKLNNRKSRRRNGLICIAIHDKEINKADQL
jgi:hypothetical protein